MSSFSTRPDSDVPVVTFESAGGLNDFRNSALRDALYELVATHNDPLLAIDLAKVDYLSSSGVAILVGLKRRVETKGGKIVIFHVQPIVRDLLAVMKLDRFFVISEDEGKAIASFVPFLRPNRSLRFPRYPGFPIFTAVVKRGVLGAPIERGVSASLRRQ